MATGMPCPLDSRPGTDRPIEPATTKILAAVALALVFVLLTRLPVARAEPIESDEFGFLDQSAAHWFPMYHTLFMTSGRLLGVLCGDRYRGFVVLDMLTSAVALASVWWMLRSLARPATALAATVLLGVAPIFWGYGAMAANYTAIVLVGSFLLGVVLSRTIAPRTVAPLCRRGRPGPRHRVPPGHRHPLADGLRDHSLAAPLEACRRRGRALHGSQPGLAFTDALRRRRLVALSRPQRGICVSVRLSELDLEPGIRRCAGAILGQARHGARLDAGARTPLRAGRAGAAAAAGSRHLSRDRHGGRGLARAGVASTRPVRQPRLVLSLCPGLDRAGGTGRDTR